MTVRHVADSVLPHWPGGTQLQKKQPSKAFVQLQLGLSPIGELFLVLEF